LYKATNNKWTCLDGSNTIAYSAINDDYCDCIDGSDEPGTSACPNSLFYCENTGHMPAYIKSTQVNDGVCDEACCDGSDENGDLVHCPNRCKQVGEAYRKEQSSLKKSTEAGLQAKRKLVDDAAKQITAWQEQQASIEDQIFLKKAELLRAQRELKVKDTVDKKKKVNKCSDHHEIGAMKQTIIVLQKNIKQLEGILNDMKRDHNQNYHDMAVKGAISAYDEFVERYSKIEQEINNQLEELEDIQEEDENEEGEDDDDILENDPNQDLDGLNDDLEQEPIIEKVEGKQHNILYTIMTNRA
jgi:protein kinase C substrate 80K-H